MAGEIDGAGPARFHLEPDERLAQRQQGAGIRQQGRRGAIPGCDPALRIDRNNTGTACQIGLRLVF